CGNLSIIPHLFFHREFPAPMNLHLSPRSGQPPFPHNHARYDKIYELTQVMQGTNTTESYSYDPVGNRLSSMGVSSYTVNSSNELTSNSNASYTYDNNGNTTSKTDPTGTTNYTWDFRNRLSQVTLPGSSGTSAFQYDPLDRRIKKVFVQNGTTTTTNYLYDGDNVVETVDANGNPTAKYVLAEGVDEPLAQSNSSGLNFYEADGLGSITSLSNSAGTVAQTYTYDSFGNTTNFSGSLTSPFRYTAREFDPETGLYYYRARYYDAADGRFISEDPAGFSSEVLDLYGYVWNNPVVFADPSGLWRIHGKWCGPNWTGGRTEPYIPSHDVNGYYQNPVDNVDLPCSNHDKCYSKCRGKHPCSALGRRICERKCDFRLIGGIAGHPFNSLNGTLPNIVNPWSYIIGIGIALDFVPPAGPNGGPEPSQPVNCPSCGSGGPPPQGVP
ncbi:MAG TPA: RHS repeat-associated core domain-containing protein, partial [Terriglobales bacterium]|nr:RHS repeat-associated core domain-containing protein [Terriglobales bacterium]